MKAAADTAAGARPPLNAAGNHWDIFGKTHMSPDMNWPIERIQLGFFNFLIQTWKDAGFVFSQS